MKCLSLWQPWATLIAIGAKSIETRSWYTRHRGPLLIHASKRQDKDSLELCLEEPFRSALAAGGLTKIGDLPFGQIVAVGDLVGCYHCHECGMGYGPPPQCSIPESERPFGNFTPGRFGWVLRNVRRFPTPISYTGHQGLFNVPDDIVAEQLALAQEDR